MRRLVVAALCAVLVGASCTTGGHDLRITAVFEDAADLVSLAQVQLADAKVGSVTGLNLDERTWTAEVTMRIDPGVTVPVGTSAVIRSTSLLGERFVELEPPADAGDGVETMQDGDVIPVERTRTAPVLEAIFQELGEVLATGALPDLGRLTSSLARIVEGQEQDIGAVIDGTRDLVGSLSAQREALADALVSLRNASGTLAGGTDTIDGFLATTEDVSRILAEQGDRLAGIVTQLDRIGEAQGELIREHSDDIDRQIAALLEIVPKVHEARADLDAALGKLPKFATFFAASGPGDYVQLDILLEEEPPSLPLGVAGSGFERVLWEATMTEIGR